MMRTFKYGWDKTHIGCGGEVMFVENTNPDVYQEWDLSCVKCGALLKEEEVEFKKRRRSLTIPLLIAGTGSGSFIGAMVGDVFTPLFLNYLPNYLTNSIPLVLTIIGGGAGYYIVKNCKESK